MRKIKIQNPKVLVFGNNSLQSFTEDFLQLNKSRSFFIISKSLINQVQSSIYQLKSTGIDVEIDTSIRSEPTFEIFDEVLKRAQIFKPDAVVGIGGGSVLDVSKLVAAFVNNNQFIQDALGIGNLSGRSTYLVCIPTTSGTGSEVSPNAILLDQKDDLKKGVVSPHLVPDATYIDPKLTHTVPPQVTAATGLDALTHCLEAYTNINAHPMIDLYALEGIRLISSNLEEAIKNGTDSEVREKLALGSLYGGLCLGPVNTTAVHALSYPLGGMFHIAHGLSNAILLPHVMEFNLVKAPERFAEVAKSLGAKEGLTPSQTAIKGVEIIKELMAKCDIPTKLSELEIPSDSYELMAKSAIKVTRLLKNNVRDISYEDALEIYKKAK